MAIVARKVEVGARGVDSLPFSNSGTPEQARKLRASGIDFLVGYLGAISPERVAGVLAAGLGFMPVTFGGRATFDGAAAVQACQALGLPTGVTVWLDLEGGELLKVPAQVVAQRVNAWAETMNAAGFEPGLYLGAPQPFTAEELYALKVRRYWKAPSRIFDRNGQVSAGPACGFCVYQLWPQGNWRDSGVFVDVNFVQQDFRGRVPTAAFAE